MKKGLVHLLLWVSCVLIVSCGSKAVPTIPDEKYRYEPEAIQLHLKADSKLNLFQNDPHSLSLCVYQLTDPNAFNQRLGDEEGLYELLECKRFDSSVATSKRLIILPKREVEETLDRGEGAKYVAIVAGYFTLQKDHMVRLFEIPAVTKRKWYNPFSKTYEPGILTINLLLGPQEIQEIGSKR